MKKLMVLLMLSCFVFSVSSVQAMDVYNFFDSIDVGATKIPGPLVYEPTNSNLYVMVDTNVMLYNLMKKKLVRQAEIRAGYMPSGIAIDSSRNIYVSQAHEGVYKFSPSGRLLTMISTPPATVDGTSGELLLTDVAISGNYLYTAVNVTTHDIIKRYRTNGRYVSERAPELGTITGLAAYRQGVYVADYGRQLLRLTIAGALARSWSTGTFIPNDVAADSYGFAYVCSDKGLRKYSSLGNLVAEESLMIKGETLDSVRVTDIAVSPDGEYVFVSDQGNHKIKIYKKPSKS